ncbi:hypothetical protein MPTK1_2g21300 [Marchantia polymorpha subsp. ruderalis]|uniref:NAD(P)-binding domain-containing protein n=2 Tax=Marchantia polymorpha TaxID=3197 RepID=A0A176WFE3_MARPO|nr:hypothetical protein AXG93_685s1050 [Marchantia polymorpha subsp. ruderalis]PTQ40412.1 hypothetical protein MARPO_0040s0084 [Marchantia polymorpha]BBN03165.1 hypothetical protein Mp_2g21300 [Marchantia polymorpha subsp. ruderalis]|eukprot:PTQ40412.1 hypothetical protein MARPO_0040s0084 [Marchantia polymorpha]
MEVSMLHSSGLRCLRSLQASTSAGSPMCPGDSLACRSFSSANSVAVWKRVNEFREQQRSVRRASSGGTRRDQQKIVARTQKRRSRHVKGVTPTKDELLDDLQQEEEADEQLERSLPDIGEDGEEFFDEDEEDSSASAEARDSAEGVTVTDETLILLEKPSPLPELVGEGDFPSAKPTNGKVNGASPGSRDSNLNQDMKVENERWDQETGAESGTSSSGKEEIVNNDDDTFTVKFTPEGEQEDLQKRASRTANDVVSNVQDGVDQAGSVAGQLSDIAQDTAEDVSNTAQNTAEEAGRNLQEAGDVVRENVEDGLEQVGPVVEELTDIAQDTVEDVAATVERTAQESGESLREAGDAIGEGLSEVASQGQSVAREGADALGEQLEEGRKEAEKNFSRLKSQAEEAGERTEGALEKLVAEAGKSAEVVGDSIANQFVGSARTAGVIGSEALRLGQVVFNAAGEAAGLTRETGPGPESTNSDESKPKQASQKKPDNVEPQSKKEGVPAKTDSQKKEMKKDEPSEVDQPKEDSGPYAGLKVTVAGATGRTGRLIVEDLVSKGVPVRALVRDPAKARDIGRMMNVEIVKVDLYKYETVKAALADSNVVICAIGATSFPFDPIGTYQAEFEGVKNLVAAAKNGGKVKKFVFITTIGVSLLQIVPLIFWKKQAELYLQRSGLDYTIIRPGGLKNGGDKREKVIMKPADTQFGGSISRRKVAELCVDAVITPEASEKIVEVVSGDTGSQRPEELFGNV